MSDQIAIFAAMHLKLTILYFLTGLALFGQNKPYESYDFHSPLKIPLVLAANFGELRTNHFHTGIDFKTNHRTGYNIYSIDDGYVSRIKVSPWGYGKVVYIDHYNGLTSVYAHCEAFSEKITQLVNKIQKKRENYEFDYYPAKDSLKVKKGEIIAISGNTGGSTAPHLHFEIRETESEDALNPLLFNFDIADTRKPRIRGIKLYSLTEEGYRIPGRSKRFNTYADGEGYKISNNIITISSDYASSSGGIGFAFDAIDQLNGANNICGIHRSFLIVDGDTVFTQDMTRVSFFTNRQINTHKDYEEFHDRRKHFHKSFRTPHNRLPIYRKQKNRGIIKVVPGNEYEIKYVCFDSYGNHTSLQFTLKVNTGEQPEDHPLYADQKKLYPDTPFMNIDDSHYIFFPQGLLYEPTPLVLEKHDEFLHFGDNEIPLDDYFEILLPVNDDFETKSIYVEHSDHRNRTTPLAGKVEDGWISVRSREFGSFEVKSDTTPPVISRRNFKDNSNVSGKTLSWSISDDQTAISEYDLYIDGVWHTLAWEPKRGSFYFSPTKELSGKKEVKIVAKDMCGNISSETYTLTF